MIPTVVYTQRILAGLNPRHGWALNFSLLRTSKISVWVFGQMNSSNRHKIRFALKETVQEEIKQKGIEEKAQLHHHEQNWGGSTGERELSPDF